LLRLSHRSPFTIALFLWYAAPERRTGNELGGGVGNEQDEGKKREGSDQVREVGQGGEDRSVEIDGENGSCQEASGRGETRSRSETRSRCETRSRSETRSRGETRSEGSKAASGQTGGGEARGKAGPKASCPASSSATSTEAVKERDVAVRQAGLRAATWRHSECACAHA
jgi:hypothetical protein